MEQRYQAVLAVIADGRGVGEVAAQAGAPRQAVVADKNPGLTHCFGAYNWRLWLSGRIHDTSQASHLAPAAFHWMNEA